MDSSIAICLFYCQELHAFDPIQQIADLLTKIGFVETLLRCFIIICKTLIAGIELDLVWEQEFVITEQKALFFSCFLLSFL